MAGGGGGWASCLPGADRNEFKRCFQGGSWTPQNYQPRRYVCICRYICMYGCIHRHILVREPGEKPLDKGSLQGSMPTNTSHQCSAGEAKMRAQMWSTSGYDPVSNIYPIYLFPLFYFNTRHSKHTSLILAASIHSAHMDFVLSLISVQTPSSMLSGMCQRCWPLLRSTQ